jgi:hypothetical protein
VRAVSDGIVNAFVEQVLVAVEVLGDTEPQAEELSRCELTGCERVDFK